MNGTKATRVLVDFRRTTPDFGLDVFEYGAESLHADPVLGHPDRFTVDNVPFFTHEVCLGDVVRCGDHADRDPDSRHWDGRVVHDVLSGEDCSRWTVAPDAFDEAETLRLLKLGIDIINGSWPEARMEGGLGLLAIQAPIPDADAINAWFEDDGRFGYVQSIRTFE